MIVLITRILLQLIASGVIMENGPHVQKAAEEAKEYILAGKSLKQRMEERIVTDQTLKWKHATQIIVQVGRKIKLHFNNNRKFCLRHYKLVKSS